ncbi:MAG: hydroxyethylthiazole kinase [Clostridium sp.]|uniref:hydroxyethylthiazole kinase n=1 Tax=Clostridium sp. TaxID=1506 RepID=UPI00290EF01C|nr:hydroxyethylthiazole kinase [Clostridium sp.]MDU5110114.1 hydroxyethylthiazole kinase [Clostridium sp.]
MFELIEKVKEVNPLVLHYTNEVTINDCANITLAIGASPLMSYSYEELEEIVSKASSVVINIGTMKSANLDLFLQAGKMANKYNKPVVLDPVGVFATEERKKLTDKLINEVNFNVIKGNIAEIKFIGGYEGNGQGVDAKESYEDISNIIKEIAKKMKTIIVATGKIDFISDGGKIIKIENGSELLKKVTGTGCMIGSLIASFLGAEGINIEAVSMGVLSMGVAGELASKNCKGIGSFKAELMNNIFNLDSKKLEEVAKITVK